jgi:hypothetical protein
MAKLIQAIRRHPRRWGVLLVLGALALVLASSVISTGGVRAQPDAPASNQPPPPDIAPASLTPFQTFSSNADRGTRVVVSTHGNVIEFNSPNTAGADYDHIAAGTVLEGYSLCYRPSSGILRTAYDIAYTESGFGAATNLTGPARVNRPTSDGVLQLNQTFTFNGQNKALTIKMVLKNTSGAPVTDIYLRRVADFDVDAAGGNGTGIFNNWHARTEQDSVFAWSEPGTASPEAHGMVLRHLTQSPGVFHWAYRTGFGDTTSCDPLGGAPPAYGDYTDSLIYLIGNLAAGASKTINIQYQRQ